MMLKTRSWTRAVGMAGVVMVSLGVGAAAQALDAGGTTTPIAADANYPLPLPDGCPGGAAALIGASWSNGRGDAAGTLAELDVRGGDVVTMSWDRLADGCEDEAGLPLLMVSLAAYATTPGGFDPAADQQLLPGSASCGAGAAACEAVGQRHELTFGVPDASVACVMQIDAVLGAPLETVGPNGSFYSAVLRGDDRPDMLISSTGVEIVPCVAAAALPESATTLPTTAVAPTSTTAAPPAVLAAEVTTPPVVAGSAATLPVTGARTDDALRLALGCLIIGTALVLVGTRKGARRPV